MTRPDAGTAETLALGVRRVLAPNSGPMTHWGTNSYIIGHQSVAIVDPGPEDAGPEDAGPRDTGHLAALLAATATEDITHILITHAHADHSPLARALSAKTGAPIYGFGPPEAGRSATMAKLAAAGASGGGEGVDRAFRPDITVGDGDIIEGKGWHVEVLHTPGHFAGHLAFRFADGILSGDHVMDWASSLVSPPDGDLAAFMATSQRLIDLAPARLFPGHGNPIDDPQGRLDWLMTHRRTREAAIVAALGSTFLPLDQITLAAYTDIDPKMRPAAARNVFAHLVDLVERNVAEASPELSVTALFRRA